MSEEFSTPELKVAHDLAQITAALEEMRGYIRNLQREYPAVPIHDLVPAIYQAPDELEALGEFWMEYVCADEDPQPTQDQQAAAVQCFAQNLKDALPGMLAAAGLEGAEIELSVSL